MKRGLSLFGLTLVLVAACAALDRAGEGQCGNGVHLTGFSIDEYSAVQVVGR